MHIYDQTCICMVKINIKSSTENAMGRNEVNTQMKNK
jgi:hypothetical protein